MDDNNILDNIINKLADINQQSKLLTESAAEKFHTDSTNKFTQLDSIIAALAESVQLLEMCPEKRMLFLANENYELDVAKKIFPIYWRFISNQN